MHDIDSAVVRAIFRKDMRAYLSNPTGYVFLTLFIGVTAAAAFLQDGFFQRNLADLALLNRVMPAILMLYVPALTMNAWADERRAGTDEILLTLPVRDAEVVLGKYLGVLGMFTVSVAFSLVHVLVLRILGEPDPGLVLSTYFGYWLMGALFCAVGLLGSMFTANATVAFVLGVVGCAALVFSGTQAWVGGLVGVVLLGLLGALAALAVRGRPQGVGAWAGIAAGLGALLWLVGIRDTAPEGEVAPLEPGFAFTDAFEMLSVGRHFDSFGEGVVQLGDLLYFVGGVALLLYLCGFLLGRRHW